VHHMSGMSCIGRCSLSVSLCGLHNCRSEREEDGPGVHLSEKDAAKAARKAAAMEKYAAQIRQLDDMVRRGHACLGASLFCWFGSVG
jgi:hypothetical protein